MSATLRIAGAEVARVGLGTNRLTHKPQNVRFVREAVAAGVGLIDSAHLYTGGESERTIGEALSQPPEGVVVATKGGFAAGQGRPDVLRAQIEESLQRLQVETIPLYYLHRVHADTPLEDSVGVLADYCERGKIGHVGLSEVDVGQIERARRIVPVAAVQNRYNLSERHWDEVVDYCAGEGIAFVPFFPLTAENDGAIGEIAARLGATATQVALAWLLRRSPTMLPIPGTLSLEHLKENLGALELELTDDEFEALS